MFTGIIVYIGKAFRDNSQLIVQIDDKRFFKNLNIGDSINVNGVCLTVIKIGANTIEFFVMEETIKKANMENKYVNLERAAKINDYNSGHLISGHINATASIKSIERNPDNSWSVCLQLKVPLNLKYKDGISIDGVSLTIAEIDKTNPSVFKICLIPHTFNNTIFQYSKVGDLVNIEYGITSTFITNHMLRAIKIAEQARQTAAPNSWVGCVIVKNDIVIGEGYHTAFGKPHAEKEAINDAINKGNKDLIKGSTFYVTLEPCHHYGKTPPCDKLLVEYGVKKVVIGYIDPDTNVNSAGMQYLMQNNIDVELDTINHDVIYDSLKPYFHQRKFGLPYCVLKVAMSIDGHIATGIDDSQWISNEKSRKDVQKLRSESHAIMVGSNTVLKDNPRLTIRDDSLNVLKHPIRVILDTHCRITDKSLHVLNPTLAPTLIFTSKEQDTKVDGILYKVVNTKNGKLDLLEVMTYLNEIGVLQCLVEGGGGLYTSFLEENLAQEVHIYRSNVNLGINGKPWLKSALPHYVKDNTRWDLINVTQLDNDILCKYKITKPLLNTNQIKNTMNDAFNALKSGKPVIIMDSPDRENEGDLVVGAENITPDVVAFIMRHTTGIICVSMTKDRADKFKLEPMVGMNEDPNGTNFMISCDCKDSTTGISAEDRAKTIKLLGSDDTTANNFTRPGHVFPLVAHKNGLLSRRGHTEASVTLCQLAGLKPVSAIAELVNYDGSVMRYDDCETFAKKYGIPLITIHDMLDYLNITTLNKIILEPVFEPIAECNIMTKKYGEWRLVCYPSANNDSASSTNRALIKNPHKIPNNIVCIRVHSDCYTGDTLGSTLCDCGDQLDLSFKIINEKGCGVIIFPACHEGRGIGLVNKIKAYNLIKEKNYNTFEANHVLGFADDLRTYEIVPKILDNLKIHSIEILTNNKSKIEYLEKYIKIVTPLEVKYNKYNIGYMETKTAKYGKQLIPENTINVAKRESPSNVGIVITHWHNDMLGQVKSKVIETLNEYGIIDITEYVVPGSFEIPFSVKKIIEKREHKVIICLGLIMKGETAHFEYISSATINGLMSVQLESDTPIINGILNCYNIDQAKERCDHNSGFGISLAKSAISMIKLSESL